MTIERIKELYAKILEGIYGLFLLYGIVAGFMLILAFAMNLPKLLFWLIG